MSGKYWVDRASSWHTDRRSCAQKAAAGRGHDCVIMGNVFTTLFDKLFGNQEMRVRLQCSCLLGVKDLVSCSRKHDRPARLQRPGA